MSVELGNFFGQMATEARDELKFCSDQLCSQFCSDLLSQKLKVVLQSLRSLSVLGSSCKFFFTTNEKHGWHMTSDMYMYLGCAWLTEQDEKWPSWLLDSHPHFKFINFHTKKLRLHRYFWPTKSDSKVFSPQKNYLWKSFLLRDNNCGWKSCAICEPSRSRDRPGWNFSNGDPSVLKS